MIEKELSFGYRTVAWLLGFNKNTVQRIFQIKGWQVRKRPIGMLPRLEAVPSVANALNERWSTDLCRVWAGRDGGTTLALEIECHTRELLGWHQPALSAPREHFRGQARIVCSECLYGSEGRGSDDNMPPQVRMGRSQLLSSGSVPA